MTEVFQPYASGVIGIMVLVIIINLLGPLVGAKKAHSDIKPGSEPEGGYDNPVYRLHRAHQNALENIATFAIPALVAMMLGASPAVVNGLVWATVALRLVYTYVFLKGIGKPAQGLRTFLFVATWVLTLIMIGMVIFRLM